MSFRYSLIKVLEVKEYEKRNAEHIYSEAVQHFEETATKLYEILRRKEELIKKSEKDLITGLSVHYIQQREKTISYLEKEIEKLQILTDKSRRNMADKEKYLFTKAIDVKKYEKMKELEKKKYEDNVKVTEQAFLDEISVQQYVRK
ncbi:flagellar export protein FliJ [Alkalicoccus daliensis]|uniref:Flagellar FliJ protein n=1 Tax=Alkalicoccus daliensis TaxID=745820 RepID=A0A1H0A475_9BACI|nr:flagellar export protein FliJ [Alkalicoccus daliensis]SDN28054.1 flagellar FliJ protein [Alkalicoccus daliensis]